jgi:uncharacterized membrane protein YcjF (UPF0283 family)
MFEATKPLLAILGIAVGAMFVNLGLKVFGKGDWKYYVDTLALVMVVGMLLSKLTSFLTEIVAVFK